MYLCMIINNMTYQPHIWGIKESFDHSKAVWKHIIYLSSYLIKNEDYMVLEILVINEIRVISKHFEVMSLSCPQK